MDMRAFVGVGCLAAWLVMFAAPARADELALFSPTVTISVKEIKAGRLYGVVLEQRDAQGQIVWTARAKEVEIEGLNWKALSLRVRSRDGECTDGSTRALWVERYVELPLFAVKK
jgi:hypothetical protein